MKFAKIFLENYKRDFLIINCGDYTYGEPVLKVASTDSLRILSIGRYCSIAFGCIIFIGRQGRHPIDTLTSYPLGMVVSKSLINGGNYKRRIIADKSLDVSIGNDVWIGSNVTILAGVTIGNGSVIGAGSVVTRNVEPYAVVAGAPAKLIKKRFEESYVAKLELSRWWELEPDEIFIATNGKFNESLDEQMLDRILMYQKNKAL